MRFIKILIFTLLISRTYISAQEATYKVVRTPFSTDRFDEYCPVFYKNGIVFCTNNNSGSLVTYSSGEGTGNADIHFYDTTSSARRSRLFSKSLRTKVNDGPVTFNATGDTIYYARNIRVEGSAREISSVRNRLGIFFAVFDGKNWVRIRELRFNNEWYNISSPCLSPDGKRLYFASDMPDGFGGSDLYYCNWENDYWGDPINMGSTINTKGNEAYPFITPAGEILFSSDGHPGLGNKDIFYSKPDGDKWLPPVRLDPPINSEYDDFGIVTDSLMSRGYFSSNRFKSADIFQFETIYPQIFYTDIQKENNYCFRFSDEGMISIDTTDLLYSWDFGDGKKLLGKTVNYCFPGPGKYNVKLDIIDRETGNLFFTKLKYSLELKDFEQPYISSPDLAIAGEEVIFSGLQSYLPGYEIISYVWDFGNGERKDGPEVNMTFKETGDYRVNMGLKLRSLSTGIIHNSGITKLIRVVESEQEKKNFISIAASSKEPASDIRNFENAQITVDYSADQDYLNDALFKLKISSSKNQISKEDTFFKNLPDKYDLKENYQPEAGVYSYEVEEQTTLMALLPAFRELNNLGYRNTVAVLEMPDSDAEIQLVGLKKNYGVLSDDYFDAYGRLKANAYLILDQIIILMNRYPETRMQIEVHTDNIGQAANNLRTSQSRAQLLANYLINRGISSKRLSAKGYGEVKPVASNMYERDRRLNRRVDFKFIK